MYGFIFNYYYPILVFFNLSLYYVLVIFVYTHSDKTTLIAKLY